MIYGDVPEAKDWVIARNVEVAKQVLLTGQVKSISPDHDLGSNLPTGYDLAKWLSKECLWPEEVQFHSANPTGVVNMQSEYAFYLKHIDDYREMKGTNEY